MDAAGVAVVSPTSATGAAGLGAVAVSFAVPSGGSGLAALGGVGVSDPAPGGAVVALSRAGAGTRAMGISRNCPSRTEKLASSPFHSASDLTGT